MVMFLSGFPFGHAQQPGDPCSAAPKGGALRGRGKKSLNSNSGKQQKETSDLVCEGDGCKLRRGQGAKSPSRFLSTWDDSFPEHHQAPR